MSFLTRWARAIGRTPESSEMYGNEKDVETYVELSRRSTMLNIEKKFAAYVVRSFIGRERLAVLDVGTGPGWIPMFLASARPEWKISAIDYSELMLKRASGRAAERGLQINWTMGDAGCLPFEDDKFDVVVSHFAFHEFPDPAATAAEMKRVLKPGGSVVVQDLKRPSRFLAPFLLFGGALFYLGAAEGKSQYFSSLRASYTSEEIQDLFSKAGFSCAAKTFFTTAGPLIRMAGTKVVVAAPTLPAGPVQQMDYSFISKR